MANVSDVVDIIAAPPWPDGPIVVRLDGLQVGQPDVATLERRADVSIGALEGDARGVVLLAALAVDLLVVAPSARLGAGGEHAAMVLRRARGICGLRVATWLSTTSRLATAEQARVWGIVNAVEADPVGTAVQLADAIAGRSAVAVATVLRLGRRGATFDWLDGRVVARCDGPWEQS
jgi:enoyl-CoA hydratase/carnithine racemase